MQSRYQRKSNELHNNTVRERVKSDSATGLISGKSVGPDIDVLSSKDAQVSFAFLSFRIFESDFAVGSQGIWMLARVVREGIKIPPASECSIVGTYDCSNYNYWLHLCLWWEPQFFWNRTVVTFYSVAGQEIPDLCQSGQRGIKKFPRLIVPLEAAAAG
jgi:hypothetical protein